MASEADLNDEIESPDEREDEEDEEDEEEEEEEEEEEAGEGGRDGNDVGRDGDVSMEEGEDNENTTGDGSEEEEVEAEETGVQDVQSGSSPVSMDDDASTTEYPDLDTVSRPCSTDLAVNEQAPSPEDAMSEDDALDGVINALKIPDSIKCGPRVETVCIGEKVESRNVEDEKLAVERRSSESIESPIGSPAVGSESPIQSPSPVKSPSPSGVTPIPIRSPHVANPDSPAKSPMANPASPIKSPIADTDSPIKSPIARDSAESPIKSPSVGPESPVNSPSVGLESLSPQSMDDTTEATKEQSNHVSSSSCRIQKESLEDQDGELDFEEETPEERREEEAAAAAAAAERIESEKKKVATVKEDFQPVTVKAEKEVKKDECEEVEEGEEGEDDGELDDDDDLEEGEVKESSSSARKMQPKPICRFYSKGQCTWGTSCRFLHPGINDKGNYNMFASSKPLVPSNGPGYGWQGGGGGGVGSGRRGSPPFNNRSYIEPIPLPLPLPPPPPPPPPPPHYEEPVRESAWERGLRHAKEILKKSNKRKEMEPDFEEKRMNLSLGGNDIQNDYEKENDYYSRSPYGHGDRYAAYGYDDIPMDPYERQAIDYWRGGNYENFEVRYTRTDYDEYRQQDRNRLRERERIDPREREIERGMYRVNERDRERSRRDKFERPARSPERNWREDRYVEPQVLNRGRGDEWRDPWRRSTSPKRRNMSRSFSSRSSASYSSSGHSSGSGSSSYSSRSRSSSASSNSSYSRSRSFSPTQHHQHRRAKMAMKKKALIAGNVPERIDVPQRIQKPLQQGGHPIAGGTPVTKGARPPVDKRPPPPVPQPPPASIPPPVIEKKKMQKPPPQKLPPNRARSQSTSGSESVGVRSRTRGVPPAAATAAWSQDKRQKKSSGSSHSRSSSQSSLVSVSSESSLSSKSSFGSDNNISTLDALKKEEKRARVRERLRSAEMPRKGSSMSDRIGKDMKVDPQADLRMKSMVNTLRASKDPLRQTGQKPQIKLTLLNKAQPAEKGNAPMAARKEVSDIRKLKAAPVVSEKEVAKAPKAMSASTGTLSGRKRPASPSHDGPDTTSASGKVSSSSSRGSGAGTKAPASSFSSSASQSKKSTSSRREELLKQLKAVEDAIARKRAKLA